MRYALENHRWKTLELLLEKGRLGEVQESAKETLKDLCEDQFDQGAMETMKMLEKRGLLPNSFDDRG